LDDRASAHAIEPAHVARGCWSSSRRETNRGFDGRGKQFVEGPNVQGAGTQAANSRFEGLARRETG
jgi:hypothetical protein